MLIGFCTSCSVLCQPEHVVRVSARSPSDEARLLWGIPDVSLDIQLPAAVQPDSLQVSSPGDGCVYIKVLCLQT